jgi:hypothetical protein
MLSALSGRLLTGPAAFAVAGFLDIALYALGSLRARGAAARRAAHDRNRAATMPPR